MSPEIHPAAAVGFGRATAAYERGRPDYPSDALTHLVTLLGIGPGRRVLDLAAGTGKLTRSLVATGAAVVAVEPVSAMRAALVATLPTVRALAGTAEEIPLRDASVDAATVAQAFHWFDATVAIGELHRVLAGGGRLGLIWNVRDEADPIQAELAAIMAPFRGEVPAHRTERWREAFAATERFTPLERASFAHTQALDADGLVDRVLSVSFIASLDQDERGTVADRVRGLVPDGGRVILPYRTDVWTAARR
jgi:SAM-dependent methyltransferase